MLILGGALKLVGGIKLKVDGLKRGLMFVRGVAKVIWTEQWEEQIK